MAINTYEQFLALPKLDINFLQPGDVLLKKIFPETARKEIEKLITGAQGILQSGETVAVDRGWSHLKEKLVPRLREKLFFENKGSPTSEHAAVIINQGMMAEAVGAGVIQAKAASRSHERYIVYRCTNPHLRDAAITIAEGLSTGRDRSHPRGPSKGGGYSYFGVGTSSFRTPTFQQNTLANRIFSTPTGRFLNEVIDYCIGASQRRPNMFCSEFAITCYEAGSVMAFGKTAFGSNPRAATPMELENILNYHPDAFHLVGHVESPQDILHKALTEAADAYGKSLGGKFRRPSEESRQALVVIRGLLDRGPTDDLFLAVEHYMSLKSKVGYDKESKHPMGTPPLKRDSTFYKIIAQKLSGTNLFHM